MKNAALFLAFLAATTVTGQPQPSLTPAAVCPVAIPEGVKADCFLLHVPENRHRSDSHTIGLPVIVLRTTAAQKRSDPVLFTVGGPGGSTLTNMKGRARIPLLRDRDVILFEQRGNRYATPALLCPEMNDVRRELAEKNLAGAEATRREERAARTCRKRLVEQGIDLDGYNTSESAADIADLRRLMGIEALNLYGISYSTQLMLEVMRAHPEGIRSVFIDSVLPPNVHYDEAGRTNLMRALDSIFADCEADPFCSRAHPRVRQNFATLLEKLNRHPLPATMKTADGKNDLPYRVNGRNVIEAMEVLLGGPETIATIPRVIDLAVEKNDTTLLRAALQQNIGEGGYAWGARLSVWCHDMAPFNDAASVARESARYPAIGEFPSVAVAPEVCRVWNVAAAPSDYAEAVVSAIPALIYAGEYDPNTPPQWAMLVARTLSHAVPVSFAGMSHVAGETQCGWTLLYRFLNDPEKTPDLTCAARFSYPQFAP